MAQLNFTNLQGCVAIDPNSAPVADPVRVFPDAYLEAAVRIAVGVPTGAIHQSDLDKVTVFDANPTVDIVSLVGMEYWTSLTSAYIYGNKVVDISPLASLTSLTELSLVDNNIVDISPLASLVGLTSLYIGDNSITNISALASLTSLSLLTLEDNTGLSDISPLGSLGTIAAMNAEGCNISDISTLSGAVVTGACIINIKSNPLNAAAYSTYLPAMIAAGATIDYSPAWRSPDGFVDSSGDWSDEALAYDGNTATYAYVAQNLNMWCNWVRFTFSAPALSPTQFRIWMSHEVGATPKTCHVKAYDGVGGEETLIYTGITEDAYVTVAVTTLSKVAYFEVRFEGQTGVTFNIYVNEVGVYGL